MNDTTINVTGSLDRYRDLTYVDDMVNALILGLDNKTRNETIKTVGKNCQLKLDSCEN